MSTRKKTPDEIPDDELSHILRIHCKDSGNCLAFTQYDRLVKTFFNQFNDFTHVVIKEMRAIGSSSGNGFILEIPFLKERVRAYCALKCAKTALSDNLYYEYYVGKKFINHYNSIFPCFLETYSLLKIKNDRMFNKFLKNRDTVTDLSTLFNTVTQVDDPAVSCEQNENYCVMIQHFNRFISLHDLTASIYPVDQDVRKDRYDLPTICYQLYFALDLLKDIYTHYDLHANNVLLYKPYVGKNYVLMKYHTLSGKIIQFKTEYIAKIIDYGRNFFDTYSFDPDGFTNSDDFVRKICKSKQCNPDCGVNRGYKRIRGEYGEKDADFIYPNRPNISHDLRLLTNGISEYLISQNFFDELHYDSTYGTEEISVADVAEGGEDLHVYNVHDARVYLEKSLMKWTTKRNKYDASWTHAATMDVYEDQRPYRFKSLVENTSPRSISPKTAKSRKFSPPFFSPGL
jgi:hypothetical protein